MLVTVRVVEMRQEEMTLLRGKREMQLRKVVVMRHWRSSRPLWPDLSLSPIFQAVVVVVAAAGVVVAAVMRGEEGVDEPV